MGIVQLSLNLAITRFKLRNEGSFFGIFWYILEPLTLFMILLHIRNIIGSNITLYGPYLILGLIMFHYFQQATTQSVKAIVQYKGIIKSLKINHESFVIGIVLQTTFSHLFEILLFIGILIYYHVSIIRLSWYLIILPPFFFFILGISFALSSLGVYIIDLDNVWKVFTRLLWFATPIFYYTKNPILLNPLYHIINIARATIIYGMTPTIIEIAIFYLVSIVTLISGWLVFFRVKAYFAERV